MTIRDPWPAILPALDIADGRLLRAVEGRRERYAEVRSVLAAGASPETYLKIFRDEFGVSAAYIADLDAIGGGLPQLRLLERLARLGVPLAVDAGVRRSEEADALLGTGASWVVAGSETICAADELARFALDAPSDRLIFSFDFRRGRLVTNDDPSWASLDETSLLDLLLDQGWTRFLALDMARVGTGSGPACVPFARKIARREGVAGLWIGGGVDGPADLDALASEPIDAVLVAGSLHDARLSPALVRRCAATLAGRSRPRPKPTQKSAAGLFD